MAMKERAAVSSSGWLAILLGLGSLLGSAYPFSLTRFHQQDPAIYVIAGIAMVIVGVILLAGNMVIGPNEARVLTFFGRYSGTVRTAGLRWVNPFTAKNQVSLRARNFETAKIKVNDIEGNPIEIGAIIVWRVVDTAQALFDVESFTNYVQIQAEAAVRNLAMHHPYDGHDDTAVSLRGQSDVVAELLRKEVAAK